VGSHTKVELVAIGREMDRRLFKLGNTYLIRQVGYYPTPVAYSIRDMDGVHLMFSDKSFISNCFEVIN